MAELTKEQKDEIRRIIQEELPLLFRTDRIVFEKHIQILDGRHIQVGRTIGTKIATATDQKLSVFGATPVIQASAIGNSSGTDATRINAIRTAIKNFGITL